MKKEINFVGNAKKYLCVTLAVLVFGIVCNIIFGTQLDISFKGGTLLKYTYVGDLDEQSVSDFIGQQLGMEVEVQLSSNDLTKDTNLLTVTATEDISLEQSTALDEALTAQYPDQQLVLSNSNSLNPSMGRLSLLSAW